MRHPHRSTGSRQLGGASWRLPFEAPASVKRLVFLLLPLLSTSAFAEGLANCATLPPTPMTLAQAELRATGCNRDVRAAAQAVDAAAAGIAIAGERPNPNLTLGTSNINPRAGIGGGSLRDKTVDSSVRLDQLVERGGKASHRIAQAEAQWRAARADLADMRRQQQALVRSAFFDVAAAQERLARQREFADYGRQSVEAAQRRMEAGEIPRNEANRFRLDAARAANDLRQAEADLHRARLDFARLIAAERMADSLAVEVAWPSDAAIARTDGERADVVAARWRVAAAEAAREGARALATRDVTVGAQVDRWPTSETNVQGTGTSFTVSVSVPLYVRHSYQGEVAKALADLDAARAQLERASALAGSDAVAAQEEWRAARERRERLERESLPAAREVAEGAEFAYRRGATGILDLLDARRQSKAAELDALQARADEAKAWARLLAAIEPYREPQDAP